MAAAYPGRWRDLVGAEGDTGNQQRDQRALQQALQQAGLDGSKTSLEFSLRQNPFAGNPGGNGGGSGEPGFGPFGESSTAEAAAEAAPISLYRGTSSASGVNLVV